MCKAFSKFYHRQSPLLNGLKFLLQIDIAEPVLYGDLGKNSICVCYAFVHVCLYAPCGHLLAEYIICPLGSRLWCITVSLSLSHWYPGSVVVLDCIDS